MNPSFKKVGSGMAMMGGAVIALGMGCHAAGARINTSRSIPLGLYRTSDTPVVKGAYVLICPPQIDLIAEAKRRGYLTAGFCPGMYGYMMKRIAAMSGDVVSISAAGVTVNGVLLPLSAPLPFDLAGRPLPRARTLNLILGKSEVLLMSDVSGTSFDGRYFGPINRAQIETVIVPVFTW